VDGRAPLSDDSDSSEATLGASGSDSPRPVTPQPSNDGAFPSPRSGGVEALKSKGVQTEAECGSQNATEAEPHTPAKEGVDRARISPSTTAHVLLWALIHVFLPLTPLVANFVCSVVIPSQPVGWLHSANSFEQVVYNGDLFLAAALTAMLGVGELFLSVFHGRTWKLGTVPILLAVVCIFFAFTGFMGYIGLSEAARLGRPVDLGTVALYSGICWTLSAMASTLTFWSCVAE